MRTYNLELSEKRYNIQNNNYNKTIRYADTIHTYLLLAECEVRTASYGPSFFLPFMAQARSARAMKTRKEKTRSITCRTDRANEANKMFIIWLC